MITFEGGAKRCDIKPRYDLIEREFLEGIAKVLSTGAEKYGEFNWQNGQERFAKDCINHVIEHVYRWAHGDRSEAHLMHAACGLMFLNHFNENHPEWFTR